MPAGRQVEYIDGVCKDTVAVGVAVVVAVGSLPPPS